MESTLTATKTEKITEPQPRVLAQGKEMEFILAGKSVFTLKSLKTGTSFTFLVKQHKIDNVRQDRWFVNLLTGPNNMSDYTYMGMISGGRFTLTGKSKVSSSAPSFQAFSWAFGKIAAGQELPNCEIWHSGHCGRCHKLLTVTESIQQGYGPECIGKVGL